MKKLATLLLAGILLSGCNMYTTPEDTMINEATTTPTEETMMAPKTVVLAAQSDSQQPGEAVFTDLGDGKTKVSITLTGKVSTVAQPAHIHTGSCPTPGAVRYPLADVVSGMSETTVDASMASLFGTEAMAVNVHKSAAEASVYVSCGDLK